jgi:hypothetical protein
MRCARFLPLLKLNNSFKLHDIIDTRDLNLDEFGFGLGRVQQQRVHIIILLNIMEAEMERKTMCDRLSDCIFAIGLEVAFWVDVFQTTMQWDEESVVRNAEEKLKQF